MQTFCAVNIREEVSGEMILGRNYIKNLLKESQKQSHESVCKAWLYYSTETIDTLAEWCRSWGFWTAG